MESRAAPPPPPYGSLMIKRVTRNRSLRGIVLFCTCCSFVWSIIVGIDYIRDALKEGISGRLKTAMIAQGGMFIALASLETVGFYAAYTQQIKAGRLFVLATIAGGILMTATEITRMALHFVFKTDIQAACAAQNAGEDVAANVQSWCEADYRNGIWRDVAWLVFGVICSFLMYMLSKAYFHQLSDPNFGREQAPSATYRLSAMAGSGGAPYGQQQGFVSPYGHSGSPNYAAGYAAPPAALAQPTFNEPPMYDAPAYAPPEKGDFVNVDMKSKQSLEYADSKTGYQGGDLASHVQHNNQQPEDPNIPGRQGEGRI